MLEDVNNVLNAGDVPNIYNMEDEDAILYYTTPLGEQNAVTCELEPFLLPLLHERCWCDNENSMATKVILTTE